MSETKWPEHDSGTGWDDLAAAMRSLKFYYPEDFVSPEEFERRKRELYMLGDMRAIYVNQGDWGRVMYALRQSPPPPPPSERSGDGAREGAEK